MDQGQCSRSQCRRIGQYPGWSAPRTLPGPWEASANQTMSQSWEAIDSASTLGGQRHILCPSRERPAPTKICQSPGRPAPTKTLTPKRLYTKCVTFISRYERGQQRYRGTVQEVGIPTPKRCPCPQRPAPTKMSSIQLCGEKTLCAAGLVA